MSIQSKPTRFLATSLIAALLALGAAGSALGDDDDHDDEDDHHHEHRERHDGGWVEPGEDVRPVSNRAYAEECGACHMAYQPGLLPGDAWQRIMVPDALLDHYGDDASLSEDVRRRLAGYLAANAAELSSKSRARAFAVGDSGSGTLPRITATRYFRNEHHEIPSRMVKGNPDVGSFSNCNTCHTGAGDGVYNEHRVRIPGYGRWDD
jgi:hypothetical protein